jgi:hypothetical protein
VVGRCVVVGEGLQLGPRRFEIRRRHRRPRLQSYAVGP